MTICPLSACITLHPADKKGPNDDSVKTHTSGAGEGRDENEAIETVELIHDATVDVSTNADWKPLEHRLKCMEQEVMELQQKSLREEQIMRKKIDALQQQQAVLQSDEIIKAMNQNHALRVKQYQTEIEEIKVNRKTSVIRLPLIRTQFFKIISEKHAMSHEDALRQIRDELEEGKKKLALFTNKVRDNLKEQDRGLADVLDELQRRICAKHEELTACEKELKAKVKSLISKIADCRNESKKCEEPPQKAKLLEETKNAKLSLTKKNVAEKKAQQSMQDACRDALSRSQRKIAHQKKDIAKKRTILLQKVSAAEAQLTSLKMTEKELEKHFLQKLETLQNKCRPMFSEKLQQLKEIEDMVQECTQDMAKTSRENEKNLEQTLDAWNQKGEELKKRASKVLSGLQSSVKSHISKKEPPKITDAYDWDEIGRLYSQIERERLRLDMFRKKHTAPAQDIDVSGFKRLLLSTIEQKLEEIKETAKELQDLGHQAKKVPPQQSSPQADISALKRKVDKLKRAVDSARKHLNVENEKLVQEIVSLERGLGKDQEKFLVERQRLYQTIKDEQEAYSEGLKNWLAPVKQARTEHQKLLSRGNQHADGKPVKPVEKAIPRRAERSERSEHARENVKEREMEGYKIIIDLNNRLFVVDAYNLGADMGNDRLQRYYSQLQKFNAKLCKQIGKIERRRKMLQLNKNKHIPEN